jgi:hypothetical protein
MFTLSLLVICIGSTKKITAQKQNTVTLKNLFLTRGLDCAFHFYKPLRAALTVVKLCVLQQLFKLFKLRYLMGYEL